MKHLKRPKKVGGNLQTIPDDYELDLNHPLAQGMRDLYTADEGYLLGKMDLKASDGWTIGAYMAQLGDRTMLDDLLAGIKPAQVVAHTLMHGPGPVSQVGHDRKALKALVGTVPKDAWQYFVSKVCIWGDFYSQGPRGAAQAVFLQSDGKVQFTERQAKEFKHAVHVRYRSDKYHRYFEDLLSKQGYPAKLHCPDGSVRIFWGRNFRGRCEILGEALAHVPQVVTTWFIKKALHNLWFDPENWPTGEPRSLLNRPRVEPMHTVHDELVVQFKAEDKEWARTKLRQWFDNELMVAGQRIKIPFSGSIGTAWSMSGQHLLEEL